MAGGAAPSLSNFAGASILQRDQTPNRPLPFIPSFFSPATRNSTLLHLNHRCRLLPLLAGRVLFVIFFLVALSPGRLPPANLLIYSWLRVVLCRPDTDLLSSPRAFAPNNATRASCLPRPLPLDRHNNIPSHPHTSASSPQHTHYTTPTPPVASRRVAVVGPPGAPPHQTNRRPSLLYSFFFFFPLPIEHCPRIASLSRDRRRHVLVGHAAECHRPLGQGMALGQPGAQGLQGPDSAAQPAGQRGCHHRPQ